MVLEKEMSTMSMLLAEYSTIYLLDNNSKTEKNNVSDVAMPTFCTNANSRF